MDYWFRFIHKNVNNDMMRERKRKKIELKQREAKLLVYATFVSGKYHLDISRAY